jgi:hypothetical protein
VSHLGPARVELSVLITLQQPKFGENHCWFASLAMLNLIVLLFCCDYSILASFYLGAVLPDVILD